MLVCPRREVHRVGRVVRAGSGDHRVRAADLVHRDLVEREPLLVGERRRLTRGSGHDDAVGAVLDQMAAERTEAVERDGTVGAERRHDRGENLAEHRADCTRAAAGTVRSCGRCPTHESGGEPC